MLKPHSYPNKTQGTSISSSIRYYSLKLEGSVPSPRVLSMGLLYACLFRRRQIEGTHRANQIKEPLLGGSSRRNNGPPECVVPWRIVRLPLCHRRIVMVNFVSPFIYLLPSCLYFSLPLLSFVVCYFLFIHGLFRKKEFLIELRSTNGIISLSLFPHIFPRIHESRTFGQILKSC